MIVSHSKKLILIHVHRTGGTSLTNVLRERLPDCTEVYTQHSNAMTVDASFFETYSNYYTFGFTRNPWERILSWYSLIHFNDQKSIDEERIRFENFIENDLAANFVDHSFHYNSLDYFINKNGESVVNRIFRFDNLHNEIQSIANDLDLQFIEIPVINTTTQKDYRDYYTQKSKLLIAQKCKKDIDYFNYTFD